LAEGSPAIFPAKIALTWLLGTEFRVLAKEPFKQNCKSSALREILRATEALQDDRFAIALP